MVLPLLGGVLGSALAGTSVLGGFSAALSPLVASAIGSGLGSFVETGDLKKGLETGVGSLVGGTLLGGMAGGMAGKAAGAAGTETAKQVGQKAAEAAFDPSKITGMKGLLTPEFGKHMMTDPGRIAGMVGAAAGPAMTYTPPQPKDYYKERAAAPGAMQPRGRAGLYGLGEMDWGVQPNYGMHMGGMVGNPAQMDPYLPAQTAVPNIMPQTTPYGTMPAQAQPQATLPQQAGLKTPMTFGNTMQNRTEMAVAKPSLGVAQFGLGGMSANVNPAQGPGGKGGIASIRGMQEGGMVTEKDVIKDAIAAIEGRHPAPEIALGKYLQTYGEEALRELVASVRRGDMARNQNPADNMVYGPETGTDMVPAKNMDNGEDILLESGEYVMPKKAVEEIGVDKLDKMAGRA